MENRVFIHCRFQLGNRWRCNQRTQPWWYFNPTRLEAHITFDSSTQPCGSIFAANVAFKCKRCYFPSQQHQETGRCRSGFTAGNKRDKIAPNQRITHQHYDAQVTHSLCGVDSFRFLLSKLGYIVNRISFLQQDGPAVGQSILSFQENNKRKWTQCHQSMIKNTVFIWSLSLKHEGTEWRCHKFSSCHASLAFREMICQETNPPVILIRLQWVVKCPVLSLSFAETIQNSHWLLRDPWAHNKKVQLHQILISELLSEKVSQGWPWCLLFAILPHLPPL